MSTGGELKSLAVALCRDCGLPACDVEDVAAAAVSRARVVGERRSRSALICTVRDELARRLGVPRRWLAADLTGLRAIGQYAAVERRYLSLPGRAARRSFELHSRRFAAANGVCPRCARAGEFTESAGRCACGFAYGYPAAGPGSRQVGGEGSRWAQRRRTVVGSASGRPARRRPSGGSCTAT